MEYSRFLIYIVIWIIYFASFTQCIAFRNVLGGVCLFCNTRVYTFFERH